MKKITFTLSFIVLTVLIAPLNAQTLDYDYNPYQYAQEELFLSSASFREVYENDDCKRATELINQFYIAEAKEDEEEKYNLMRSISFFQCEEAFDFLEYQIIKNPSETDRCHAIMFSAWTLNFDFLPSILEYAKKDTLSIQEKAAVATALMAFGIQYPYLGLKEESVSILEEICVDTSLHILGNCIFNYFSLGGDTALQFFTAQLAQKEYELYAALFLAQLGEHIQTFPLFEEALSSEDSYEVHLAIMGLVTIGTEEAIELVLKLPPENRRSTPKRSLINFDYRNIKEGD